MESVMPSALRVPICEPTSRSGACRIRTRAARNAKQTIIAIPSVIAIFTMVHRKSSKCSRNGLEVSLSGRSRNLKISRSAILMKKSTKRQRQKTTRRERRANAQCIGVANFVLRDHAANLLHSKFAAIENRFRFLSSLGLFTPLNRTCQKEVAALIRESRRRKIIAERNELAVFCQLVTGFFAQFVQRDLFDRF